jgi:hypothetical protein
VQVRNLPITRFFLLAYTLKITCGWFSWRSILTGMVRCLPQQNKNLTTKDSPIETHFDIHSWMVSSDVHFSWS